MATTGGNSQKPSAVALLEVGSVDELIKSEAHQWQSIRLSTKSEVRTANSMCSMISPNCHCSTVCYIL